MGAVRLSLSLVVTHLSLCLCTVAITPTLCAACALRIRCFHCVTLCCHLSTPLLYALLLLLSGMIVSMVSSRPRLSSESPFGVVC